MDYYNEYVYRMHKHGNDTSLVVLMQMGDFYETYDQSAGRCQAVLGLTLNEQVKPDKTKHFITGFPKWKLEDYLQKLVGETGCRVVVLDKDMNETVFTKDRNGKIVFTTNNNNSNNNSKTTTTMATTASKTFKMMNSGNRYMYDNEMQALVEVKLLREVFNLDSGASMQEWRVANTDRTVQTHYTPATEDAPEQFDGKMYRTLEDFEKGEPMGMDAFCGKADEERICRGLVRPHRSDVQQDEKGAYFWTIEKGEAVKWYFRDHIHEVTWDQADGPITVTSDYEGDQLPVSYPSSEHVYKYNDYRFIDEYGEETVREAPLKRLMLDDDQKALAGKLQSLIDQCKEAGMTIYWSNADYTLNAVNVRRVERIEYDPCVDEEKEEAHYFDDSRAAHTFKNVTDLNSEDSDLKFVIKKQ